MSTQATISGSVIDVTQPQQFDIQYGKSLWKLSYLIKALDGQEVWCAKVHLKSIELFNADGVLLGVTNMHNWKSDVDVHLSLSGTDFTMTRNKGFMNESKSFDFGGKHLTWKRAGLWKESGLWKLVDEHEHVLATIGYKGWKPKTKFEIVTPSADIGFVHAMLITGISELDYQRRVVGTAVGSSASSSAAVAAAVA